jgi:hypothetical protein
MSTNMDDIITKVSACELESVKYVNQWKTLDKDNSPHPLDKKVSNVRKNNLVKNSNLSIK